jgi:hypothetical protein
MGKRSGKLPPFSPGKGEYEVGYAKPPVETRFKKGKSGNPRGRKKGAKNKLPALHEERLKSIVIEEAYRTINVNDGNRQVTMPMAKAIIRSLTVSAVKGQSRAQKLFMEMLTETERSNKQLYDDYAKTMLEYKWSWEEEIERCQRSGITPPEPIPHPNHITLDHQTGQILITGPMSKEEKVKWDKLRARKMDCIESIKESEQMLCDEPDLRDVILQDMEYERRTLHNIQKVIPD